MTQLLGGGSFSGAAPFDQTLGFRITGLAPSSRCRQTVCSDRGAVESRSATRCPVRRAAMPASPPYRFQPDPPGGTPTPGDGAVSSG